MTALYQAIPEVWQKRAFVLVCSLIFIPSIIKQIELIFALLYQIYHYKKGIILSEEQIGFGSKASKKTIRWSEIQDLKISDEGGTTKITFFTKSHKRRFFKGNNFFSKHLSNYFYKKDYSIEYLNGFDIEIKELYKLMLKFMANFNRNEVHQ